MFHRGFTDEALKVEYQDGLAPEKVRLTRISVALATLLNVGFVALDVWAIPSALTEVWCIRLAMNGILFACLAATWHPRFQQIYQAVAATTFLTLGFGVNTMILVADEQDLALDAYYTGLLLTTFGLYTLTHVRIVLSIAISMILISTYVAVSIGAHDFLRPEKVLVLVVNLFFFVGATVLGIAAQGVRDRYSRENYLLRHSLQRDIEVTEEEKRRVSYLAEHDALTGLPNRASFEHQATEILDAAAGARTSALVMFVDLNNFKPINDTHGHDAGDRVLKVIAERLRSALRSTDSVARYGGDEFVVCLPTEASPAPVLRKLYEAIEQPIELRGARVAVSASIGAARFPDDGRDLDALIKAADAQMYARKQSQSHLRVART